MRACCFDLSGSVASCANPLFSSLQDMLGYCFTTSLNSSTFPAAHLTPCPLCVFMQYHARHIHWLCQDQMAICFREVAWLKTTGCHRWRGTCIWSLFLLSPFQWLTFHFKILSVVGRLCFRFRQSPDIDCAVFRWYISLRFVECYRWSCQHYFMAPWCMSEKENIFRSDSIILTDDMLF